MNECRAIFMKPKVRGGPLVYNPDNCGNPPDNASSSEATVSQNAEKMERLVPSTFDVLHIRACLRAAGAPVPRVDSSVVCVGMSSSRQSRMEGRRRRDCGRSGPAIASGAVGSVIAAVLRQYPGARLAHVVFVLA